MVITMHQGCPKMEVAKVISTLREAGLEPRIISPDPRVVLGVVEELSQAEAKRLSRAIGELAGGVEEITNFEKSWKLASKSFRDQPTTIDLGSMTVGGPEVLVVGGPCAVERREQFLETAGMLDGAGATALRGGAFKPRSSPYSFRGLGEEGLQIMAEAPRAHRPAHHHRGALRPRGGAGGPLRRRVADRHPQHAELRPAGGGGRHRPAGALEAGHDGQHQGATTFGRVHSGPGQLAGDALRAGHPHL